MSDLTGSRIGIAYPILQSPFQLARKTLRNRLVHASMTTRMQAKGLITDRLIRYYANRAAGGAAMIVSEPLAMLPSQADQPKVQLGDPANADGFRRWVDAVTAHDSLLLAQVQHPGRGRHVRARIGQPIGPSVLPDDLSWSIPHALSASEIGAMIDDFAQGAARLQDYGFAGVEISAGHGHLFHQFLSPHSNRREDGYGGDLEGRTRLLSELMAAIRTACGADFIQISGEDATALGFVAHGGVGCISVTANVAPKLCCAFQTALLNGDFKTALSYQDRLMPLHKALFLEPGVSGTKYALKRIGRMSDAVRLPLLGVEERTAGAIDAALRHAGLID